MFDFAWSEFALVGVVALIAIGPKDMPVAIKTVSQMIKKARRMASEFQTHVDELVREADLHEVRDTVNSLRGLNLRSKIEKAIDADGSLRATFASNPLAPAPAMAMPDASTTIAASPADALPLGEPVRLVEAHPEHTIAPEGSPAAPAFIPPAIAEEAARTPVIPPAFVPPGVAAAPKPRQPAYARG